MVVQSGSYVASHLFDYLVAAKLLNTLSVMSQAFELHRKNPAAVIGTAESAVPSQPSVPIRYSMVNELMSSSGSDSLSSGPKMDFSHVVEGHAKGRNFSVAPV